MSDEHPNGSNRQDILSLLEPDSRFYASNTEPSHAASSHSFLFAASKDTENGLEEVLRIEKDGRIFWLGREVETDDDFRAAMIDLSKALVKLAT